MARNYYNSSPELDDYYSSSSNVNNYYDLVLEMGIESYIDADHSKLKNLDYEHSGHTGFASSKQLEEETERAKTAEAALEGSSAEKIEAEAKRAKEAEEALGAKIDAETARAKDAESALGGTIQNETDRATKAEAVLSTKIEDEVEKLKLFHIVKAKTEGTESELLWEDWDRWQTN